MTEAPSAGRPARSASAEPVPAGRVPRERVAVGLILLAALAVRLAGIGRGLPYLHEWDEPYRPAYLDGGGDEGGNSGDLLISPAIRIVHVSGR